VTLSSPAFPSLLQAPVGAGVPILSSTGTLVGSTLSCTAGAWAGDLDEAFDFLAPQSFAYSWSENGAPIAGAASSTLPASSPGSYACQVTASNQAGSTTQSSAPVTVTAPPAISLPSPQAQFPRITRLGESAKTWRTGTRRAQISANKPPLGTTFSFTLNEAASVSFTFTQSVGGRRVAKKCVAQTSRNRHKAKCARAVIAGSLPFTGRAGVNKVRFYGVIGRKTLKPGSYTLLVSATAASRHSATSTLHFTIAPS